MDAPVDAPVDQPLTSHSERVQAFLTRLGDPFETVLVDRDGRAGVEFGVTGVPETFVVGRDGVVVAKHTGPLDEAGAARLANQAR